jgi:hypothetical protein
LGYNQNFTFGFYSDEAFRETLQKIDCLLFGFQKFSFKSVVIFHRQIIVWWIQPINATGSNSLSFWAKISLGVL